MKARRFPKYASHNEVKCFNCQAPMKEAPLDTGYPEGGGRYRQTCQKCNYHTYYDLAPIVRRSP